MFFLFFFCGYHVCDVLRLRNSQNFNNITVIFFNWRLLDYNYIKCPIYFFCLYVAKSEESIDGVFVFLGCHVQVVSRRRQPIHDFDSVSSLLFYVLVLIVLSAHNELFRVFYFKNHLFTWTSKNLLGVFLWPSLVAGILYPMSLSCRCLSKYI